MSKFVERWEPRESGGGSVSAPFKPRLEQAIRTINRQIALFEQASARLAIKDRELFERVVKYYSSGDMARARIYATELAEVRKLHRNVYLAMLAFKQIAMRLTTIRDFGDIVSIVAPALDVVKNIRAGVAALTPEADKTFSDLSDLFTDLLVEATQTTGVTPEPGYVSEEARKILEEAAAVAEQQLKSKLPPIPVEEQEGVRI